MLSAVGTEIGSKTSGQRGIEELSQALMWLATGALLGVIVAMPYDRLLGLPGSTGTVLGSAVWCVLLGVLHMGRVRTSFGTGEERRPTGDEVAGLHLSAP